MAARNFGIKPHLFGKCKKCQMLVVKQITAKLYKVAVHFHKVQFFVFIRGCFFEPVIYIFQITIIKSKSHAHGINVIFKRAAFYILYPILKVTHYNFCRFDFAVHGKHCNLHVKCYNQKNKAFLSFKNRNCTCDSYHCIKAFVTLVKNFA